MPRIRSSCAPGCGHPGHMMFSGVCGQVSFPEPQKIEISSDDDSTSTAEEEKSLEAVVQADTAEKIEELQKEGKKVSRKYDPSSSSSTSDTSSSSTSYSSDPSSSSTSTSTSTSTSDTSSSSTSSSSSVKQKSRKQNAQRDSKMQAIQKATLQDSTLPGVKLVQASASTPSATPALVPSSSTINQDTQVNEFYPSYGQARILSGVLLVALVVLMLAVYFMKRESTKRTAKKNKPGMV